NGRTSRLIMDHVLLSFRIRPAIVADPNQDILLDLPGWVDAVRRGVIETENVSVEYLGRRNE
ncbi:MAG: hypothetical protein Q8942_16445, partial [Bacillota bacterium]|nr:hypothetical protein [Bacillota bacterium]